MDQAHIRPSFTNAILEGSAILFVGAGLSFLSKNKNGTTLPNGELLKQLHTETGTKKVFPLEKISSFYVKKFGSARLYEYLLNALTVHSMSKELVDFYKLPWRRIYTTNYDNAIEFARHSSRGKLGIASTIASKFSDAETAFKNAYARENSKSRPNTIRIDNYYARFQLEHAAWIDGADQAFRLFKSGFNLLLKQIFKDDNRHYPFKAGRALAGLAAKHYDHWSTTEQQSFAGGCSTLLKKAQEWTTKNKSSYEDVSAMIREINLIMKRIGGK